MGEWIKFSQLYKGVIDLICEPILSADAKPKDLSEMKVKRVEGVKKSPEASSLSPN
jgi:hypothetical protein